MKVSPQDKKFITRLKSSKFSAEGFLGDDKRPVDEIISDDLLTIQRLGISVEEIADILKQIYKKARSNLGASIEIREGVTATFYESMGRIPSPFIGDGVFEKGEAVVTDQATGKTMIITQLGINLIEKHRFFQGRGSRYRTDPEDIAALLL